MEKHELTFGDICTITSGKHAGKRVLVIKNGISTKFGVRAITVEYIDKNETLPEKVWVAPEQLKFAGECDTETAEVIKEADFQEWKARKDAGVPPKSAFAAKKPWMKNRNTPKSDGESDDSF
jgi:hypothetical protein